VTNVTNFGAFVDVGVHQDGLVHISALADRFIKDPHDVVRTGDLVKVKVMDVDLQRRRIALTMRLGDKTGANSPVQGPQELRSKEADHRSRKHRDDTRRPEQKPLGGALAAALVQARGDRAKRQ
jgi:uncharacterized protein